MSTIVWRRATICRFADRSVRSTSLQYTRLPQAVPPPETDSIGNSSFFVARDHQAHRPRYTRRVTPPKISPEISVNASNWSPHLQFCPVVSGGCCGNRRTILDWGVIGLVSLSRYSSRRSPRGREASVVGCRLDILRPLRFAARATVLPALARGAVLDYRGNPVRLALRLPSSRRGDMDHVA